MAEGAMLTDDLRIDTRLANRSIVPTQADTPNPLDSVVQGVKEGINALDRNADFDARNAARQRQGNEDAAKTGGVGAALNVGSFLSTPSTDSLPLAVSPDIQGMLDRGAAMKTAVAQGKAPQAALETAAQNAKVALFNRYGGTGQAEAAVAAFNTVFSGTAAGQSLASQVDASKAAAEDEAKMTAADQHNALLAAAGHGITGPNALQYGMTIVAADKANDYIERQQTIVKNNLDIEKAGQELKDTADAKASQAYTVGILAKGGTVIDHRFEQVRDNIKTFTDPTKAAAWLSSVLPALNSGVDAIETSMYNEALSKPGMTKDGLDQIVKWGEDQKKAISGLVSGDVQMNINLIDLAMKNTNYNFNQVAPAVTWLKGQVGGASMWQTLNDPNSPLAPALRTVMMNEVQTALQEYTAGDTGGAMSTLLTLNQLKTGALKPEDIDPKQVATQNAVAQAHLIPEANAVNKGDDSNVATLISHNNVAIYNLGHTAQPGTTLKTINAATASLLRPENVSALLHTAANPNLPAQTRYAASQTIGGLRNAAVIALTSARANNGANDDFKDNETGAWQLKLTGNYYTPFFNQTVFNQWAAANPDKAHHNPISVAVLSGRPGIAPLMASNVGVITAAEESRLVPQSVKLKMDSMNRALQVLTNPEVAAADPTFSVTGGVTQQQLADHYIKGTPLPGQQPAVAPVSANAVQEKTSSDIADALHTEDWAKDYAATSSIVEAHNATAKSYAQGEKHYGPQLDEAAKTVGIDRPEMLHALVGSESSFNPNLDMTKVSEDKIHAIWKAQGRDFPPGTPHTAKGLFMFTNTTGASYGLHGEDASDPDKAIPAGAKKFADDLRAVTPGGREPTLSDYENAAKRFKGSTRLTPQESALFEAAWDASEKRMHG